MKAIKFSETYYAVGSHGFSEPKYEAGKTYPVTEDAMRNGVARGIAEEVDVPEPQPEEAAPSTEAAPTEAPAPAEPAPEAVAEAKPAAKAKK